jgi:hypothetical protein
LWQVSRPSGAGDPRTTAEFLHRSAQTYAGVGRAVIGVLGAALAPFAGPPAGVGLCVVVSVGLTVWSIWYAWRMRTDPRTWVWVCDVAVLGALALAQPLLVAPHLTRDMAGWVTPVVSFGVVTLQWHTAIGAGFVAAGGLGVALVVGAAMSPGVGLVAALFAGGVWTIVEGGLSRLLWRLVQRGGRIADEVMAAGFAQEREAVTAAARRADQRLHWSTVHDTAASTLLMIGLGEVRGDEPWLAGQIERDIAALEDEPTDPLEARELGGVLAIAAQRAIVEVHLGVPDRPVTVPGAVAVAFEGAVGEALENVRRHAGTGRAVVRLLDSAGVVRVTVSDSGAGFEADEVPDSRHGLALSVRERMARAGARARIRSRPGAGTVVELEWPRG